MRRLSPEMIGWFAGALAAAALAVSASGRAYGDEPVSLRADLRVAGGQITLGDLFDVADPAASAVVARAPEPGRRMSLDPDYVREVAARNDLAWANPGGLRRVTVTRASTTIPASEIEDAIRAAVEAEDGGAWAVRLSDSRVRHVPADIVPYAEVLELDRDPRTRRFTALISLSPDVEAERIDGRVEPAIEVPVLTRPISRDEIITAGDIDWRVMPEGRAPSNAVTDADQIIGFAARRSLRAGAPLRAYDLTRPAVVERGETVLVVFESAGIRLTARARAMADSAEGETARFVNLQSNRMIDAVVVGPGLARVGEAPASAHAGGRP